MVAVTIKEARARLNWLVAAVLRGEQVVLMRGSRHVAAIVPVSSKDLEIAPRLTDGQAERFWREIAAERRRGAVASFASAEAAVAHLGKSVARRRSRRP